MRLIISISKLYGVSVDYLVNEDMQTELDVPVVKATAAYYRLNYKIALVRVAVCFAVAMVIIAVGLALNAPATTAMVLGLLLTVLLLFFLIRSISRLVILRSYK